VSRDDVIPIYTHSFYVGAYFLSNSLHLNARKYTGDSSCQVGFVVRLTGETLRCGKALDATNTVCVIWFVQTCNRQPLCCAVTGAHTNHRFINLCINSQVLGKVSQI